MAEFVNSFRHFWISNLSRELAQILRSFAAGLRFQHKSAQNIDLQ